MKTSVLNFSVVLIVVLFIGCKTGESLSKEEKVARIEKSIDSRSYTFVARTAIPTGMKSINLNSDYSLKVRKDSIDSYLPYFGRAYIAPMNPSEGGIKFISTDFEYKISEKKKGGWDVDIQTNDTNGRSRLNLSISDNGNATLTASDNNRQSITFYGEIEVK